MKKPSLEERFTQIAEKAITEAEHIECSFEMFVEGLRTMEAEIKSRRELAQDELRSRGEVDE